MGFQIAKHYLSWMTPSARSDYSGRARPKVAIFAVTLAGLTSAPLNSLESPIPKPLPTLARSPG